MPYFHVFQKKPPDTQWNPAERDLNEEQARTCVAAGARCVLRTDVPFEEAWEKYCVESAAHTDASQLTFGVPPMHSQLPQVWDNVTNDLR